MEVDGDDDGFNLIQPTLLQQLRKILDEYPDDGQILKVKILVLEWDFVFFGHQKQPKNKCNPKRGKVHNSCLLNIESLDNTLPHL